MPTRIPSFNSGRNQKSQYEKDVSLVNKYVKLAYEHPKVGKAMQQIQADYAKQVGSLRKNAGPSTSREVLSAAVQKVNTDRLIAGRIVPKSKLLEYEKAVSNISGVNFRG